MHSRPGKPLRSVAPLELDLCGFFDEILQSRLVHRDVARSGRNRRPPSYLAQLVLVYLRCELRKKDFTQVMGFQSHAGKASPKRLVRRSILSRRKTVYFSNFSTLADNSSIALRVTFSEAKSTSEELSRFTSMGLRERFDARRRFLVADGRFFLFVYILEHLCIDSPPYFIWVGLVGLQPSVKVNNPSPSSKPAISAQGAYTSPEIVRPAIDKMSHAIEPIPL